VLVSVAVAVAVAVGVAVRIRLPALDKDPGHAVLFHDDVQGAAEGPMITRSQPRMWDTTVPITPMLYRKSTLDGPNANAAPRRKNSPPTPTIS